MTADTLGGVWSHAMELAAGLGRHDVQVDLATMGAPPSRLQRAQATALRNLTLHESAFRLEWMADPWADVRDAGDWLLTLESRLQPDLVHLNQFAFGSLPFVAPTLLVAHSCVLSWWQAVYGEAAPPAWEPYHHAVVRGLAGADLVAAPTRAMLSSLLQNYGHGEAGLVLPNARSPAAYSPGRKEPFVLSAGRLWDAAKNLSALESVAPRLPWPIRVAGPHAQPTGGVREACGVEALGELAPEALAALFARAAIYALPARYEPFGQTALEAALSGCALVLGDVPSLREVWRDAAIYVPPDDHEALGTVLQRLISRRSLRERLATKARARALQFSPTRMVDAYLAAYGRLLAPEAGAAGTRGRITRQRKEPVCAS